MTLATARLAVRGLVRRFPRVTALDGVNLAVASGEVLALLGENGAGKSTLVEVLGGGLTADAGELLLDGASYRPRGARDARRSGVAVVHQHFQLVDAFTVAENLRLNLTRISHRPAAAARDAPALAAFSRLRVLNGPPSPTPRPSGRKHHHHRRLPRFASRGGEKCGLTTSAGWAELERRLGFGLPPLGALVAELGIGDRQRLEIGRALLTGPRLLLLDEPTAVLTPGEAGALFTALRRLAATGVAIVFITHRLDEVRRVADRVIVLRQGRVVGDGPADGDPSGLARLMTGQLPPAPPRTDRTAGDVALALRAVACPPRLAPLDLELRTGEIVVLAGVDGNGQVAAAERAAALAGGPGRLEIAGRALVNPAPELVRRLGVWAIPSDRIRQGVAPGLAVAENLVLGRRRPGQWGRRCLIDPARVHAEAQRLIARFAVVARPEQPAGELSGGNQQKLVVARAVAARPLALVAIHPTRGLDVAAAAAVRGHLLAAAGRGTAVLAVTSDLEEALAIGDRILVFSRGRVIGEGGPDTSLERLARWVGGEAA